MTTISTTTQALTNANEAAGKILAIIDGLGFTTDKVFDPKELRASITAAILGNNQTNVGQVFKATDVEPTEAEIEELLEELKNDEEIGGVCEEVAEHIAANVCPSCGGLMR